MPDIESQSGMERQNDLKQYNKQMNGNGMNFQESDVLEGTIIQFPKSEKTSVIS